MSELVNAQSSAIERRLSRSLSATRILAQGVRENNGLINNFEDYAEAVLKSVGGISNLQLAPDGIIRFIHPLKGNENALGHNILQDDRRRKEALLAVKEHRLTLAGPFELIQGGVAVIGRNPVYLPTPQGEQFWGFASALIFLEDLLKATELNSLEGRGYSYQLNRLHPDTGVNEVFASSASPLTADSYSVSIQVPNATWNLVVSRSQPTPKWRSTTGYIFSALAGLLAVWIVYYILQQPEKLRRTVIEKTRELEYHANNDALTGLANRRFLSEQLDRVLREHPRYSHPAVLMYMDLDDFKRVNDSMGHAAGDTLLQQIADRLKRSVRDSDIVTRLGGDEFGILLLDSESVRDVGRIAAQIIDSVEQPVRLGNKSFVVSTSIGITMIPTDGQDNATILKNADLAMYSAKKSGKRNFCFYNQSLQAAAIAKQELEDDLCLAINEKQFVLHYQPIVSLSTGELDSCEALIRWQHPQRGLLYPDKFISSAEETGKIIDIGYWVIERVCNQIKWAESGSKPLHRFSINLSPKQFKDPLLIEKIRTIIQSTDIDARLLELEVTESCVMEDVDAAIDMLAKLKELGITIALDDFGTGYSSLSLLKRLPVDRLKIDQSFARDLETDSDDQKIVEGLISMAHKLELNVVAEGIETEDQLQFLRTYQCDFGQGYLFSKPAPIDQLEQVRSQKIHSFS